MTDEQFHKVTKALSDPKRFAIFSRIVNQAGELPCKKIVQSVRVSQATISHHLKELTNAGLIEGRKDGQCMHLSARRSVIEQYQAELRRRLSPGR